MPARLYYAHDPMCSWCYAFRPSLTQLLDALSDDIQVIRLLGGLAKDSDEPMPEETRRYVIANWQRIEETVPGTTFNYDFWARCTPRRSTYPACRAVIAAREQGEQYDAAMTTAIQDAYYLQARNPSDTSTHIELADELGLDTDRFKQDLLSPEVDKTLRQEIKLSRQLGLNSFPGLLFENDKQAIPIQPDYVNAEVMLDTVKRYSDNQ